MSDEAKEAEHLRLARMELAHKLAELLPRAVGMGLQSEAALIALLTHSILLNQTHKLLEALHTTKPGA